jgi:eukaryotic-like serine/threonine-protein kinase
MNPERWRQVKEIVADCLDLPEHERAALARARCGDDRELLREVESLLAQHPDESLDRTGETPAQQFARHLVLLEDDEIFTPGEMISNYRIEAELNRGGMGVVYRATDTKLDRTVALKVLARSVLVEEERKQRFLVEARAAAALHNPRIATVFGMEEWDGVAFIVMEYIEGESLAQVLNRGPIRLRRALDIAIGVAEALALAHERGIVHRDLKPSNIMLDAAGEPKVIDFGLAKLTRVVERPIAESASGTDAVAENYHTSREGMGSPTRGGQRMGTAGYMSPEQTDGRPVTPAADLFSFGVVLHEMLEGKRPVASAPARLARTSAIAPPPLQRILDRCLAAEVSTRYASGRQALEDLVAVRDGLARAERSVESSRRLARRSSWAAAAIVVGAITVAVIGRRSSPSAISEARPSRPRQLTSGAGLEERPAWAPDGRHVAYDSDREGNSDIWVANADGGEPRNLTADFAGDDIAPSWSPVGDRIAFYSQRDGAGYFIVPASGGAPWKLPIALHATVSDLARGPACWSPGGDEVAILREKPDGRLTELVIASTQDGHERRKIDLPGRTTSRTDLSWSPDGHSFAYRDAQLPVAQVSQIWVMDARTEKAWPVTDGTAEDRRPLWSPDGRILYFLSHREGAMDLWAQRLDENAHPTGAPHALTSGIDMRDASISRDGSTLAYSRGRSIANLWSFPIIRKRPARWEDGVRLTQESTFIEHADIAPDGGHIAFSSDRAGVPHLWLMPATGGEPQALTSGSEPDWAPRWSTDGKQIAFYSNRSGNRDIWIRSAADGHVRQITTSPEQDEYPTWSPDGRTLAYFSATPQGWEIRLVPASGGTPVVWSDGVGQNLYPEWSADSRWIYFESTRSGEVCVWKGPAAGGAPQFVTIGSRPRLSRDGSVLFFLRGSGEAMTVWQRSLADGAERPLTGLHGRSGQLGGDILAAGGGRLFVSWREDIGDLWSMTMSSAP